MKLYLAPLEGITTHVYRNALEQYFPGADRYFTPFIAPNQSWTLRTKEMRDVLPENNQVPELIPQILTNNADYFLAAADQLKEMGYEEVNLNLGCPSGTVVSRKRGSGLLQFPEELDALLEQIFLRTRVKVSVKTRIGRMDAEELQQIMEIYSRYPLTELIIHPRTQKEFYRPVAAAELYRRYEEAADTVAASCERLQEQHLQKIFQGNVSQGPGSLCYNGNILSERMYQEFAARFPGQVSVMLGRGALANPGLIHQIRTGEKMDKQTFRAFHDRIVRDYMAVYSDEGNTLHRMKELWIYMQHSFSDSEKYMKKIRKAQKLSEYKVAFETLLREQDILPEGPERWNLPEK